MDGVYRLQVDMGADASALTAATRQGAKGFDEMAAAGERAATATREAGAQATTAAAAEAAAGKRVGADAAADAAARQARAAAMRAEAVAQRAARAEANLLANANRQLAMQMTDVFTSVASGMPVWMVAIQQGGQIRDAYGGVAPALRAIQAMASPTALAIGAVAVAAGAAALAYNHGWAQSKAFSDGMALTGNTAALTEGRFNSLVASLASARKTGAGAVRDLLQVLATSGDQTAGTLDASARAALAMSRVNGKTAADTAASFAGMGDSVSNWAAKANKAYNYLTGEQYKQIMALEAQGRTAEAMRLNMEALADTMETRNVRSLGYIETALNAGKTAWSDFWDAASGWGRAETIDDQIAALERRIRSMGAVDHIVFPWSGGKTAYQSSTAELEALQKERARGALREADKAAENAAEQEAIAKASRGYQDGLLSIQAAGDALLLAQQTAGFTARKAQADRAYAEMRISGERYRDELIAIERGRIAAQEAAARKAIAIESARVVKTEQEANARTAAVINAQARLAALTGERAKLAADVASGRFDPNARNVLESPQAAFRSAELAAGGQVEAQIRAQAEATLVLARAQADYVLNLQQANAARDVANGRDLAGRRMGDGARDMAGREAAIADQFNQARQQLDADLANNKIGRATFEERLATLRAFYDRALQLEADYQDTRIRLEADATVGFDRALANYAEKSRNVAKQSEQAWTSAFQAMEDGMVQFALTGKASFGDLVNSIVAGLIRIWLQKQLVGMFDALGGYMTSISGGGVGTGNGYGNLDIGGFLHGGGRVGYDAPAFSRAMPSATWDRAPRLHSGRLNSDEYAAILQRDESVLTPGQMRMLAPAGRTAAAAVNVDLKVINQTGTPVQASTRRGSDGGLEVLLTAVKAAVADDLASGQGDITSALQGRYGLRPALS